MIDRSRPRTSRNSQQTPRVQDGGELGPSGTNEVAQPFVHAGHLVRAPCCVTDRRSTPMARDAAHLAFGELSHEGLQRGIAANKPRNLPGPLAGPWTVIEFEQLRPVF